MRLRKLSTRPRISSACRANSPDAERTSLADAPVPPHSVEAEQAVLGGLLLEDGVQAGGLAVRGLGCPALHQVVDAG